MKFCRGQISLQKLNFLLNKQLKITKLQISDYNIKYFKALKFIEFSRGNFTCIFNAYITAVDSFKHSLHAGFLPSAVRYKLLL